MIVIHIDTMSDTARLKRMYEGLANITLLYNEDRKKIDEVLSTSQDDLVMCLGHGSPFGLFGNGWRGYAIDSYNAKYLRDKTVIGVWCYASDFADKEGLKGFFTSMFISNIGEAKGHGFPNNTNEDIHDEIDFFSDQIHDFIQNGTDMSCWVKILQEVCHKEKDFVRFNYEALSYFDTVREPKRNSYESLWGNRFGSYEDDDDFIDSVFYKNKSKNKGKNKKSGMNFVGFKSKYNDVSNMDETKNYCPKCGHLFVQGEYEIDYDYGNTRFYCPECDWHGTQYGVMNVNTAISDLEDLKDKFGLEDVEITEEDAQNVIIDVTEYGYEYEDALNDVLDGIVRCLDEGVE